MTMCWLDKVNNFQIVQYMPETGDKFEGNHTDFDKAKKIELQSWNNDKIFEGVPCDNQKCI